jgi:hypothetical protein
VTALCGAVVSRAQAPTTATTDKPNAHATHRAKNSLWLADENIGNLDMLASCDGRITHLMDEDSRITSASFMIAARTAYEQHGERIVKRCGRLGLSGEGLPISP